MRYNVYLKESIDKKRILFIPGWNNTINKEFIDFLANDYSVLALSLEGIDPTLVPIKVYKPKDYIQEIEQVLKDMSFFPDYVIAHSCGNKFIASLNTISFMFAPSIFKPRLSLRFKTKIKIIRNKMIKKINRLFKIKTSKKYFGSTDYQNCSGIKRKIFLILKDYYPADLNKYSKNLNITIFDCDSAIDIKSVKIGCKKNKIKSLTLCSGTHSSIYDNPSIIKETINNYENNN